MKSTIKTFWAFALFALVLVPVIVWIRMPSDALRTFVLSALAAGSPGIAMNFDSAEFLFPPGIALTGLTVQSRERGDIRVYSEGLTAHPDVLQLLTGRLALRIRAAALGGRIEGEVAFKNRFSAAGPLQADFRFDGINADSPGINAFFGRQVSGKLDGQLRFDGQPRQWSAGSGHIELSLVEGRFSLQSPAFGLDEMIFTRVEGNLDLEGGSLKVNRLYLSGEQLQGTFRGDIRLEGDLTGSRLTLRGDVKLPATGQERFAVAVGGTIARPVVTPL